MNEASPWRRFLFPLLFVTALFVALFLRRPEAELASQPTEDAPKTAVSETTTPMVFRGQTMGTTYTLKLIPQSEAQAQSWQVLQAKVDERLEAINDLMSTYRPKSNISKLNQNKSVEAVPLDPEFGRVVQAALEIGNATSGAFDITLAPLIELWGFDKGARRLTPPSAAAIKALQPYTGLNAVSFSEGRFQKKDPRVQINLSGIAKGYGVDAVGEVLRSSGVTNFMVEIGGEILVQGKNASGKPWRLGVNRPTPQAGRFEIIATAEMSEGGLATSGSYRNFFDESGKRFHHIIDPTSGSPVQHNLVSVTVIAPSCMVADALATAAMVMGRDAFEKMRKEKFPEVSAYFVHQEGATFKTEKTDNFPLGTQKL